MTTPAPPSETLLERLLPSACRLPLAAASSALLAVVVAEAAVSHCYAPSVPGH